MITFLKQVIKKISAGTDKRVMASENKWTEEQEILKRLTREQLENLRKKGLSIPVIAT